MIAIMFNLNALVLSAPGSWKSASGIPRFRMSKVHTAVSIFYVNAAALLLVEK